MFKGYRLRDYNFKLVILVMVACIFGTIVINSADSSYTMKQVIGLIGCLGVMGVISLVDYHYFCKTWLIIYGFNLIMLLGQCEALVWNRKFHDHSAIGIYQDIYDYLSCGIVNEAKGQIKHMEKSVTGCCVLCSSAGGSRAAAGLINNH